MMDKHLLLIVAVTGAIASCNGQVECPGDWKGGGRSRVIPAEQINDGYCDCPITGADEPDTSACAGSFTWSGVGADDESTCVSLLPQHSGFCFVVCCFA